MYRYRYRVYLGTSQRSPAHICQHRHSIPNGGTDAFCKNRCVVVQPHARRGCREMQQFRQNAPRCRTISDPEGPARGPRANGSRRASCGGDLGFYRLQPLSSPLPATSRPVPSDRAALELARTARHAGSRVSRAAVPRCTSETPSTVLFGRFCRAPSSIWPLLHLVALVSSAASTNHALIVPRAAAASVSALYRPQRSSERSPSGPAKSSPRPKKRQPGTTIISRGHDMISHPRP